MRCEDCQGTGRRLIRASEIKPATSPEDYNHPIIHEIQCPDCGGSGIIACCEGTERQAGVAGESA